MKTEHHMGPRLFAGIVLFFFFSLAIYWGFQIIEGVLMPFIFASIAAIALHPVYNLIKKGARSAYLSSFLTCLLTLVGIGGTLFFIIYLAVGEVVSVTQIFTQSFALPEVSRLADVSQWEEINFQLSQRVAVLAQSIPFVDIGSLSSLLTEALKQIPPLLQDLSATLVSLVRTGLNSIGQLLINFVMFLIILFFLLMDGKTFVRYLFNLLPINGKHEEQILKRFKALSYSWIFVTLTIASLQAVVAGIGYTIAGVPSPVLWGMVTGLGAFIPFAGSAIVWLPLAIIFIVLGQYWWGIFLILWGLIPVGTTDNFLRPFLLRGGGVELHPLILFISIFGGLFAYGVFGLVLGPIIVVFISTVLYIYQLEFGPTLSKFHTSRMERDVE